jgi:hypothetical protein
MLVVLGFLCAYMIPNFWSSALFSRPWFLMGFVLLQIIVLASLMYWSQSSTQTLVEDVTALFRPWKRRYGIHVAFRQVAGLPRPGRGGGDIQRTGNCCFVLVFHRITNQNQPAEDVASADSVGTAEDSSEGEDDDHRNQ